MEEGKTLNLNEILDKHKKWLSGEDGGERANLYDANLRNVDLRDADLRGADLRGADLRGADLYGADLRGADLCGADLYGADLYGADLRDADLRNVRTNISTIGYWPVCPEEGAFIGYKKARGCIVKLRIPETAKRSSATTRKCRCSEAEVLAITGADGTARDTVASNYSLNFIYQVGKTVTVPNFDDDRWNECSTGIHFFITREEAETWTG